ncbi:MAG: hypothetical protein NWQ54_03335 [Paraglaciecola sp.]|nr:hypothetical protein [Paraglaciecola sp.]
MTNYSIEIKHLSTKVPNLQRWCLDYPRDKDVVALTELTEQGIVFQGWVLLVNQPLPELYLLQGEQKVLLTVNRNRPDVIQAVLNESASEHPQLCCGFRYQLPITAADFVIGVQIDQQDYPLLEGKVVGAFQVLRGKADWLFLDNDTNKSVEQYTGQLLMERSQRKAWQKYFAGFKKLVVELDIPSAMLMAPAKESVYSQYYPFEKAKLTATDELLKLVPSHFPLCYPVAELKNAKERTFRVTDTHWSVHGAAEASKLVAEKLGIAKTAIDAVFSEDKFQLRKHIGDLGNKVFPPASHEEAVLISYNYKKFIIYDNQLPNFGRALVIHNETALLVGQLLVFGSSSAYSMLDYLSRIFSTVTLVHTAGNIDVGLVKQLRPEYLLTQTNARFVIKAPSLAYSLQEGITEKLQTLELAAWQQQAKAVTAQAINGGKVAQVLNQYFTQPIG